AVLCYVRTYAWCHRTPGKALLLPQAQRRSTPRCYGGCGKEKTMDLLLIILIVLIVLSLGGWGYGYYSVGPAGTPPAPMFNGLGVLALLLIVAVVVLLATGWRFGLTVHPPVR